MHKIYSSFSYFSLNYPTLNITTIARPTVPLYVRTYILRRPKPNILKKKMRRVYTYVCIVGTSSYIYRHTLEKKKLTEGLSIKCNAINAGMTNFNGEYFYGNGFIWHIYIFGNKVYYPH